MKIILLGSKGLVGSALKNYFKNYDLIHHDIDTLNLNDLNSVKDFFKNNKGDVLINAFGKNNHIKIDDQNENLVTNISEAEIEEYFHVNTLLVFRVCREYVLNNPNGKILNFSSLYGHHVPRPSYYENYHKSIGYCLSKAAVVMLTKYFAVHFPDFEFIDIVLGGVKNNQPSNFINEYIKDVPKNRLLNADEIGPAIEGLLKSKYITGTSIFLDGGKNLM